MSSRNLWLTILLVCVTGISILAATAKAPSVAMMDLSETGFVQVIQNVHDIPTLEYTLQSEYISEKELCNLRVLSHQYKVTIINVW